MKGGADLEEIKRLYLFNAHVERAHLLSNAHLEANNSLEDLREGINGVLASYMHFDTVSMRDWKCEHNWEVFCTTHQILELVTTLNTHDITKHHLNWMVGKLEGFAKKLQSSADRMEG
jgi:hypothetical protein